MVKMKILVIIVMVDDGGDNDNDDEDRTVNKFHNAYLSKSHIFEIGSI